MPAATLENRFSFGLSSLFLYERTYAGAMGKLLAAITSVQKAAYDEAVDVVQSDPGGFARFSEDAQYGAGTAKLMAEFNKMPLGLFEALTGKPITEAAGEANGFVSSAPVNTVGTSISASISAAALTSGAGADLPLGRITIRAVSATTVNILTEYSDVPVNPTPITIVTGSNVIDGLGFTLTGAGSISMVAGDEAYINARPSTSKRNTITRTGNERPKQMYAVIVGQELVQGEMLRLVLPKVLCASLPLNLTAKEHTKWSLEFTVMKPVGGNIFEAEFSTRA